MVCFTQHKGKTRYPQMFPMYYIQMEQNCGLQQHSWIDRKQERRNWTRHWRVSIIILLLCYTFVPSNICVPNNVPKNICVPKKTHVPKNTCGYLQCLHTGLLAYVVIKNQGMTDEKKNRERMLWIEKTARIQIFRNHQLCCTLDC